MVADGGLLMASTFKLNLDDASIRGLTMPGGLADQAAARLAGRVRDRAKQNIRAAGLVDTGNLMQSIVSERVAGSGSGGQSEWRVGSNIQPSPPARYSYAVYQHEGHPGRIYPRRKRVLRFQPRGKSFYVFPQWVSGYPGSPYLTDAATQVFAQL